MPAIDGCIDGARDARWLTPYPADADDELAFDDVVAYDVAGDADDAAAGLASGAFGVGGRRVRGDGNCFYRAVGFSLLVDGAELVAEGVDELGDLLGVEEAPRWARERRRQDGRSAAKEKGLGQPSG